jgi:hypothetical protein
MDKLIAAVAALGGLIAIGGLIDLALYKAEKEKLNSRLEYSCLRARGRVVAADQGRSPQDRGPACGFCTVDDEFGPNLT